MHAYDAKESPIPSPMIVPPSSMLSLIFNPQEFFVLENYYHLKNKESFGTHFMSSTTEREDHHHQATRLDPYHLKLSRIQQLDVAAIRQLVADSVATTIEAQAANMANADNTIRNPEPRETPVARKFIYKEFMSCQPFNFKGVEGTVGLICWFKRSELVFSSSNCTKNCKVKFATATLTGSK
nr:reverse transcriptase domain-containing protein [Tanacetum cinerariifolium]